MVDTETDGLHPHFGHRPFLVGLASTSGKTALLEPGGPGWEDAAALLMDRRVAKVGHNVKFDWKMLRAAGLNVRGPLVDTMLMAQLADNHLGSYALKSLARTVLREKATEEADLKAWLRRESSRRRSVARKYGVEFSPPTYKDAPRPLVRRYLEKDLEYTAKLLFAAGPRAARFHAETARVENALVPVVARMEERGMAIDGAYFAKAHKDALIELSALEASAHAAAGTRFLVSSSKQLADVLLKRLGLKCLGWTDKGNPKFDDDTLPRYDHPVARAVVKHRHLKKMDSTYYEPFMRLAEAGGGSVHSTFNILGAKRTGRMSGSNPSLQVIPRKDKTVRRGFVCRPDTFLVFADYSQIEMRLFAHFCKSDRLVAAFKEGRDLHLESAVMVFGEAARDDDSLRFCGKTLNFSVLYGAGPRALYKTLRKKFLEDLARSDKAPSPAVLELAGMTQSKAADLLQRYYKAYPEIRQYLDLLQREVYAKGRVLDAFGRPYRVQGEYAYRAGNYQIQGCAAGVMKRAILRVERARADGSPALRGVRLVNCVHDELVYEAPIEALEDRRRHDALLSEIRSLMEDWGTFRVPITVDFAETATNWADKREAAGPEKAQSAS